PSVRTQRREVMDVVAVGRELRVEADVEAVRRFEPLREAASRVLSELGANAKGSLADHGRARRLVDEGEHLVVLVARLVPTRSERSLLEIVREDHRRVLVDADV